jgi:hypothetical protein
VQIQKAIKLTYDNADDLVYGHYGRRVEVICTNGTVFTGKVGWYAEDMGEDENEWGVCFDDVTDSAGKTLSGYCVEIPHIESVTPLERANTEEEIKRLFG